MSREKDYIPSKDELFDSWQKNLITKLGVKGKLSFWEIPERLLENLKPLQDEWKAAYAAAKNPANRTETQVHRKHEARSKYESALRIFVKGFLTYNPMVTDLDREDLELPIHKKERTPAPVPSTSPGYHADNTMVRRITIHFRDDENDKRAKPEGVHGAEIKWDFSETPITSPDQLLRSCFDTASPFTLDFDNDERGRKIYYALRWENTRGEKGPWSDIGNSIVP